jgi:type I restriction enzyme, S subunit
METDLPNGWSHANLGDLVEFKYGKSLPANARKGTKYPVYGSNGIVGRNAEALTNGACIIVGRKGSFGEVAISRTPAWPIDTTYYVDELYDQPLDFWYRYLQSLPLKEFNRSTAVPGLRREDAYALQIKVPPLREQERISQKIEALFASLGQVDAFLDIASDLLKKYQFSTLLSAFSGSSTRSWRSSQIRQPKSDLNEQILTDYRNRRFQASASTAEIDDLVSSALYGGCQILSCCRVSQKIGCGHELA